MREIDIGPGRVIMRYSAHGGQARCGMDSTEVCGPRRFVGGAWSSYLGGRGSKTLGWGGVTVVAEATGIAESTIRRGLKELETGNALPEGYQRRSGGGRKKTEECDPKLVAALNRLLEPTTLGDPQCPLRWTTKSTRSLSIELTKQGHPVGPTTVRKLLRDLGYSLQANRKTREGKRSS